MKSGMPFRNPIKAVLFLWVLCASTPLVLADGTVTTASFSELKSALSTGGTVTIAVNGTFAFTSPITITTNTSLVATGYSAVLSGGGSVRLFNVNAGAELRLDSLILRDGASLGAGGATGLDGADGKYDGQDGGPGGAGEDALAGAIYNAGTLRALSCTFSNNTATAGDGGSGGAGGSGPVNGGVGGTAGAGGFAKGGAIYNLGQLILTNCYFVTNSVLGGHAGAGGAAGSGTFPGYAGQGGTGGLAWGGTIFNAGTAAIYNTTIVSGYASGGNGAKGGSLSGGAIGRDGTPGAEARGGGIHNAGTLTLVNSTLADSDAFGGDGGEGGDGGRAGDGANGGPGMGGNLYNIGTAGITNVTFSGGRGLGGAAGVAGSGSVAGKDGSIGGDAGGNLANLATLVLVNSILADPLQSPNGYGFVTDLGHNLSSDHTPILGGPGSLSSTDPLLGDLQLLEGFAPVYPLLTNSPAIDAGDDSVGLAIDQRGKPRPLGAATDIGAYEAAATFFIVKGQLTEAGDPLVGYTVRAGVFAATTDGGGFFVFNNLEAGTYVVAPVNVGVGFNPVSQTVVVSDANLANIDFTAKPTALGQAGMNTNGLFELTMTGMPDRDYVLEFSTNLSTWIPVLTNQAGTDGTFDFTDTASTNSTQRFYRGRTM